MNTLKNSVAAGNFLLYPREVYVGIRTGADRAPYHFILLPGDVRVENADEADEFAKAIGGVLPTHAELAHMHVRMRDQFKPSFYYTSDEEELDGDMCRVVLDFATDAERATQNGALQIRARVIRRVPVQSDPFMPNELTVQSVELLATRLIDQQDVGDSADNDDYLVVAGLKLGIAQMAMKVRQVLKATQRKQGGEA